MPALRGVIGSFLMLASMAAFGGLGGGATVGATGSSSPEGTPSELAQEPAGNGCGSAGCVTVVAVSGLIDPLVADGIIEELDATLSSDDLVGVVLQIDSPGVVLSDREFTNLARRLDRFPEQLSVWVGPSGAEARGGSAELVALSPDSSIAPGSTMHFDGTQRLNPSEFGQLVPEEAQQREVTLEAEPAQRTGMVGEVAPTLGDALVSLDWFETRVVEIDGENRREPVTIVRFVKLPLPQQLLHTAASPAVAYLAFVIGLALLLFEFYTAGVGVAGVVGAGSLLLGGYGLGVLPIRSWAVALIVASMVAFAVDVQTGIPRFWAAAGMVGFTVGSLTLFEGVPFPWVAVIVGIIGMASMMFSGMPSMVRARFGTPTIGRTWMVGEMGEVTEAVDPEGMVLIQGALWRARANRSTPLKVGDTARVVEVDGLLLEVEPEEGGAKDYRELRKDRTDRDTAE